jgi:hypothetical protein
MNLKETQGKVADWIQLAQEIIQLWDLVNMEMNFWVP